LCGDPRGRHRLVLGRQAAPGDEKAFAGAGQEAAERHVREKRSVQALAQRRDVLLRSCHARVYAVRNPAGEGKRHCYPNPRRATGVESVQSIIDLTDVTEADQSVVSSVTAFQERCIRGGRWLVVSPFTRERFQRGKETPPGLSKDPSLVVYDDLGGGVGQTIGFIEGREAAQPFDEPRPVDAINAALVDEVFYKPLSK